MQGERTSPGPALAHLGVEEHREALAFAAEVATFFRSHREPGWTELDPQSDEYLAIGRKMDQLLIDRGWYTMHWPAEVGGQGDLLKYAVLRELEGYFRVPTYGGHGRFIVGPALARFGTQEQKERFLPPIARGEDIICQGFTEPDAGSDLGALKCRAERVDGGGYSVSGTKLYITYGAYATSMLLAAVTDLDAPKYQNMSLFLIDMDSPGLSSAPLVCLTGHEVSVVYLDDVFVSEDRLVGEPNRGFYHMAMALNFERSGLNKPSRYIADLEDLSETARDSGLWSDRSIQQEFGRMRAEIEAWRVICWRVIALQLAGEVPSWEASLSELYRKHVNPQFSRLILDVLGRQATIAGGDEGALDGGRWELLLRDGFNNHGQGGRFVTRNVIARRGLGLGRGQ